MSSNWLDEHLALAALLDEEPDLPEALASLMLACRHDAVRIRRRYADPDIRASTRNLIAALRVAWAHNPPDKVGVADALRGIARAGMPGSEIAPFVICEALDLRKVHDAVFRVLKGRDSTAIDHPTAIPRTMRPLTGQGRRTSPDSVRRHQPGYISALDVVVPRDGLKVRYSVCTGLKSDRPLNDQPRVCAVPLWNGNELHADADDKTRAVTGVYPTASALPDEHISVISTALGSADVVVLPELSMKDAVMAQAVARLVPPEVVCVAGSHSELIDGGPQRWNQCNVYVGGHLVCSHRKIQPMFPFGLTEQFEPGDTITVIATLGWQMAAVICADLNSPVVVEMLENLGLNVLAVPSMSPTLDVYEAVAHRLLISNQTQTVVANQWIEDHEVALFGRPFSSGVTRVREAVPAAIMAPNP